MKNYWKEVRLGDICKKITKGTTPSTYGYSFTNHGIKFIKAESITKDGSINPLSFAYISEETHLKLKRSQIELNDILFTMAGVFLGKVSILKDHYMLPANTNQAVAIIRISDTYANPFYVYYFLRQDSITKYVNSCTGQSAQPNINLNEISNLRIILPSIDIQNCIVNILKSLDDKIELNNKINRNLEAQAQAIFKSWFIDFEPFKGSMPSKWHYGNFSEIINSIIGGDWGKDSPTEAYIKRTYCIRGADIPSVKMGNKGKIPFRYILDKNYQIKQLQINDIVVEISGGSPTQSTGRCVQITQALLDRYDSSLICTNFCRAIKPQENYSSFVYHYLQYLYNSNIFFLYENGTTGIKNLDLNSFLVKEQIIVPSIDDVVKFNQIVCDISDVIYANSSENEKLAQLRDTLLPKLMSSEVDMSNIAV